MSRYCSISHSGPGLAVRRARRTSLRPFESIANQIVGLLYTLTKEKRPPQGRTLFHGGEGGIRTLGTTCVAHLISSQARSTTPAPLQSAATVASF